MSRLLQISQLGHPILREKAEEVQHIQNPEVQELIDDMIATVADVNGVGIAAPQVYRNERIFIIASRPGPRYPDAPELEPTAMVNPVIIHTSNNVEKEWEGCLSIPGIRGLVPRYKTIKVGYYTRKEKYVETELDDFIARIFQHELDHLNGMVFLDRLDSTKDVITEKEFQKLIRK